MYLWLFIYIPFMILSMALAQNMAICVNVLCVGDYSALKANSIQNYLQSLKKSPYFSVIASHSCYKGIYFIGLDIESS